MKSLRRVALCSVLLAGCHVAAAQQLTVSAAASLGDAMREIARGFEATRPGVTLRLNIAASGVLLQQLVMGAPVDVLASADTETVQRGIHQQRLLAGSRREFAGNVLVLVVPLQDAAAVRSIADLGQPSIRRVAIGKPAIVPAGRYAREALEQAGLWLALQERLIHADSVRQVLDYVARGEVNAGFVYRSDAGLFARRVRVAAELTTPTPIRYAAAVASDSRQPALAHAFTEHLMSPTAQATLARHGFAAP